eukprot:12483344-Prorocentrum_lima.AAC.1
MTSSLVGSEMCIRDRDLTPECMHCMESELQGTSMLHGKPYPRLSPHCPCLLYTSDAADDM